MNLLALDTSTEVMTLALQRELTGHSQVYRFEGAGGAQTSARLIPEIFKLLAQAQLALHELSAIAFGGGPGSFTGLRTACAVAQGLGFGAGVPLLAVDTLMAMAEEARWQIGAPPEFAVTVLLDARMGEWYTASYEFRSELCFVSEACHLIKPENLRWNGVDVLAGNVFEPDGARLPAAAHCLPVLPSADAMLRLAPALLAAGGGVAAAHALPTYIRDKVALTTQELAQTRLAHSAKIAVHMDNAKPND